MAATRKLTPCPDSPNCVSSLASDPDHRVEPLRYEASQSEAKERLLQILQGLNRVTIVVNEPRYIYAEFRSTVFGFVDDVEFLFAESEPVIHVRSASRVGYYDFGANRSRVEQIRTAWSQHSFHDDR